MSSGDLTADDTLRQWVEREHVSWERALRAALNDAIEHLQSVIFDEGWPEIRATTADDAAALRASVRLYEDRLTDLLRVVRLAGVPASPVDWSLFKTQLRRWARDTNLDITLRTTLDEALYRAESTPLGDHARYLAWTTSLMLFAASAVDIATRPLVDEEAPRLEWAYRSLAHLEEHAAFHAGHASFLRGEHARLGNLTSVPVDAILDHEENLQAHPRFDLFLNAVLHWLADAAPPPNDARAR